MGAILLKGQRLVFENIVPNPSFEKVNLNPNGWFYMGSHFTESIEGWSSPTVASPDIFSPIFTLPPNWVRRGFGLPKAYTGNNYVGITIYGCTNGKPHCREYIQIKLKERLVPGQSYKVSMWLAHFAGSLYSNNIGVYFSENPLWDIGTETLHLNPHVNETDIVEIHNNQWTYFRNDFIPEVEYKYLTIGNFFIDERTETLSSEETEFNFAYYYIDDIMVQKIQPIVEEDETVLVEEPFEIGKAYALNNIYFAFNETGFLPASYIELNKLLKLMREHPNIRIQINGHTDDMGNDQYNNQLSNLRAKAVADYLFRHEIQRNRVKYSGFGSTKPQVPNADGTRRLNRRVEFIITGEPLTESPDTESYN